MKLIRTGCFEKSVSIDCTAAGSGDVKSIGANAVAVAGAGAGAGI